MKKHLLLSTLLFFLSFPFHAIEACAESYPFKAKILEISLSELTSETPVHYYDYDIFKNRKDGDTFITGIDSHWSIKIEVLEAGQSNSVLRKGEKIVFVIHSPVRDIGYPKDNIIGQEVNLDLEIKHEENGKVWLRIQRNRGKKL